MSKYILNPTDSGCELRIQVSANSKDFKITGLTFDNVVKIKCTQPPLEGRANREIESRLAEFFGAKTQIKQGSEKSTKKWAVIDLPIGEAKAKLDKVLAATEEKWQKSR
ncbi:MAG: DUF167 family protein [archaeon]